ncbi:MAG: glycosyltransferase family 4 protein [Desulfobulbales bacterium]|nr:glycosyltransferase family 4 protein [Desulfobulbales bacterium]
MEVEMGDVTLKKKLKIAVLIRRFVTSGGKERYAVEVTKRLRDRGHEIHLFCREFDQELTDGMVIHRLPVRWRFSSALSCLAFARDCAKQLPAAGRFDIIHSHERAYCQDVLTIHTFSFKGGLRNYPFFRRLDQTWLSYRSWLYLLLERKQMATPQLVAVSEAIRQDGIRFYGRHGGVTVIEPGVDLDQFNPVRITAERTVIRQRFGIDDDELLILFVGSEFKRKGLDRLIPAIAPGMRLLVLGRGDNLSFFHGLAAGLGMEDRVHFAGLIEGDVGGYYAAADVVVLPSRSEAFGMTVLEGMAAGLPVLVSRECGVAPLINTGEDGFVFDDSEQLARFLAELSDRGFRQRVGAAARRKAEAYSWDMQTDKYERLFREMFANRL